MFRLFPCILFLILCSTLNARPSYTDSLRLMLQQLDQVVENRSIYDNRKEQKIERLKNPSRWQATTPYVMKFIISYSGNILTTKPTRHYITFP